MKTNYLFLFITLVVVLASCEPLEKSNSLPSLKSQEEVAKEVNLKVENTFPGGNIIALSVDDGIVVHWETEGIDSFKNQDTIRLRSKGEKTITANILTKGGIVKIPSTIEVTSVPNLVPEPFAFLIDYFGDGKAWVYASDYANGTLHWFLSAPYNWNEVWWAPLADGLTSKDGLEDELFFEKKGNKFFLTVTPHPGAEPIIGEFTFDIEKMLFTVINIEFPDMDNAFKDTFEVKVLNENELVLYQDEAGAARNTGWTWRFKRKGYKYLN